MIETVDVMGDLRIMVVLVSDGSRVVLQSSSVARAASVAQEYIGNQALVFAVFDGKSMYAIEWDSDPHL